MKFKVEIDIDWINEDDTIDNAINEQIQNKVSRLIFNKIEPSINDKFKNQINDTLDKKIQEIYEDFMNNKFTVYDRWGDPQKEGVNVKEILKEKLDRFMTDTVSRNGKVTDYGGEPRWKQIIDNQGKKQINDFMSRLSKDVVEGIKEDINAEARERVTKAILSDYDLKKLIK